MSRGSGDGGFKELEDQAKQLGTKVIRDVGELPSPVSKEFTFGVGKDKEDIVILEDATIILSDAASESRYPARQYLKAKGKETNKPLLATPALIQKLRERAKHAGEQSVASSTSAAQDKLLSLIGHAVQQGASDIHLMIDRNVCHILFRVNGVLENYSEWVAEEGIRIHQVAYNFFSKDKTDNFNQNALQDISFTVDLPTTGQRVRIRSSNVPTNNRGCSIVYRLLSIGQAEVLPITDLGYTKFQERLLHEVRGLSSGLVLFCGETGSGKTTSLASILSGIDTRRKVYSIEDPVEKLIPNVAQIPVDVRDEAKNFAYYLRALLRQDPDVIMVGEIRDRETAEVAIQAALTGHLMFSTLHTRFAVDAVLRLSEFGIPLKFLATPNLLRMIIAQELHPLLCHDCRRKLTDSEKETISTLYTPEQLDRLYTIPQPTEQNKNCEVCKGKGIKGRKVYAELIKVDRKSHDFIAEMNIKEWERYLREKNFLTLKRRVKAGILSGEIDALDIKSLDPPEVESFEYEEEVVDA